MLSAGTTAGASPWSLESTTPGATLADQGFVFLTAEALRALADLDDATTGRWARTWNDLPPDRYLKDGGRYRSRRHSCFVQDVAAPDAGLSRVPHRPHWQSTDYNALHGGIDRLFEPITAELVDDPAWARLLTSLGRLFATDSGARRWSIEAHQFRIDTRDGMGRPTPEGAHRDGVDYVAVILVGREAIKGGETRIFEADGPRGMRFVMTRPWSAVLLNDRRMIHEATPIQPASPTDARTPDTAGSAGHRDTLVLTYRADGFQRPAA
ncbi:MAG: 2OG-Fe dioxygenase family protein [Burkholderiaceae bacterium]